MAGSKYALYLGHIWMNITVGKIIRFFGIVMQISIEPRNMGGYPSYFVEDSMVHLGHVYYVQLRGYDAWSKDIMTLILLKYIHSSFHNEAGTSFYGYKYHQLRYFYTHVQ